MSWSEWIRKPVFWLWVAIGTIVILLLLQISKLGSTMSEGWTNFWYRWKYGKGGIYERPEDYAKALYESMKGLQFDPSARYGLWKDLIPKSDSFVNITTNHFNDYYGEGYTLRQWIESEWIFGDSLSFNTYKEEVLLRLSMLGH